MTVLIYLRIYFSLFPFIYILVNTIFAFRVEICKYCSLIGFFNNYHIIYQYYQMTDVGLIK